MKMIQKLVTLTAVATMLTTPVFSQDSESPAYGNGSYASYLSVLVPVGVVAAVAIIAASTDHDHHSSSSYRNGSNSSHAHSHQ